MALVRSLYWHSWCLSFPVLYVCVCVCVYVCDYYHYHFFFNYYCCSPASPQILYNGVRCVILVRLCVCMLLLFFFFYGVFSCNCVCYQCRSLLPLLNGLYVWLALYSHKEKEKENTLSSSRLAFFFF